MVITEVCGTSSTGSIPVSHPMRKPPSGEVFSFFEIITQLNLSHKYPVEESDRVFSLCYLPPSSKAYGPNRNGEFMLTIALCLAALADDSSENPVETKPDTFFQLMADTAVALPNASADTEVEERLLLVLEKPFTKKLSLSVFAEATPKYGEIYAGPTLHVGNLALTLSVGVETDEFPLRGALTAYFSNERFTFFACGEHGGSGPWYKSFGKVKFGSFSTGFLLERFDGIGPTLALETHGLEAWVAPIMYDYEDNGLNLIAGISWIP